MNGAPRRMGAVLMTLALVLPQASCGAFIEYTDGLRTSKEYTPLVRGTAQTGGFIGVLASIPVDIVALPLTYSVYVYQGYVDPDSASLTDTTLFPLFLLRGVGSLLAVPVDVMEFAFYRAWTPEGAMTAEEQEEFEGNLDDDALPQYPVTPVYPTTKRG